MQESSASTDRWIRIGIIILTIGTALVHFGLLFPDPVFILNALGYLTLLGALYLPIPQLQPHHKLIRRILIGYTLLALVIWAAIGLRTPIAYLNKVNELLLVGLLIVEERRH